MKTTFKLAMLLFVSICLFVVAQDHGEIENATEPENDGDNQHQIITVIEKINEIQGQAKTIQAQASTIQAQASTIQGQAKTIQELETKSEDLTKEYKVLCERYGILADANQSKGRIEKFYSQAEPWFILAILVLLVILVVLLPLAIIRKKKINELRSKIDNIDNNAKTLKKNFEDFLKNANASNQQSGNSNQPKNLSSTLEEWKKQIINAVSSKSNPNEDNKQLRDLVRDIGDMKSSMSDLKKLREDVRQICEQAKSVFESINKQKDELDHREQNLKQDIQNAEDRVRLETTNSVRMERKGEIEEKDRNINKLNAEVKELSVRLSKSVQENSSLKADAVNAESNGYKKGLDANQSQLAAKDQEIGRLRKEKESIKAEMEAELRLVIAKEFNNRITSLQGDLEQSKRQIDEKNSALAESQEAKRQLQTTCDNLKSSVESLKADNEKQKTQLLANKEVISGLQASVYPKHLLDDTSFDILKGHLEDWTAKGVEEASIVRANLNVFAQRNALSADSWKLALKNISLGVGLSLRKLGANESQIIDELVLWGNFLGKYSDDQYDFSLKIPALGDNVDSSWMSSRNNKATTVTKVLTWAVFHNQYGVQHNAEIE